MNGIHTGFALSLSCHFFVCSHQCAGYTTWPIPTACLRCFFPANDCYPILTQQCSSPCLLLLNSPKSSIPKNSKWVCLKIGYIPNYSHLIGIMISKTIGCRGLAYFQTHPSWFFLITPSFSPRSPSFFPPVPSGGPGLPGLPGRLGRLLHRGDPAAQRQQLPGRRPSENWGSRGFFFLGMTDIFDLPSANLT